MTDQEALVLHKKIAKELGFDVKEVAYVRRRLLGGKYNSVQDFVNGLSSKIENHKTQIANIERLIKVRETQLRTPRLYRWASDIRKRRDSLIIISGQQKALMAVLQNRIEWLNSLTSDVLATLLQ